MRWDKDTLTFSYSDNRYYANARQAAREWTDLGTGISIVPAPSGQTGDLVFDDVHFPKATWAAQAEVPPEWAGAHSFVPTSPHVPSVVHIWVDLDKTGVLDDAHMTYAMAHEIGHALGLAHSDSCKIYDPSIMLSGGSDVPTRLIITPQYYDKIELEELYSLPRG